MQLNKKAEVVNGSKQIYTELVVAAHQDDIEIMCPQAIIKGYQSDKYGVVGVVCADGSGSPRSGPFAHMTNEEMMKVRRLEQIKAAEIGDYSALVMLNYTSGELKDRSNESPKDDIKEIILNYKPETMYIHNLADKHPTHVGTAVNCIKALRELPKEARPKKLYGCEVWRNLDWLADEEKVFFDLTGYEQLMRDVLDVYESQIAGGKEYCTAAIGRRAGNATFSASHGVDVAEHVAYGMDLTILIEDDSIDPKQFIVDKIMHFAKDILI
ncbi:MAG: PIG-L family deacetylase [Clostridia bacterium]|nr:PIG-L family deacetylase [Clostridia bacterium]